MPIPALDGFGLLPTANHDCTLDEIEARFGSFQHTDQRPRLFTKLAAFVAEAKSAEIVRSLLIDGSFATAKAAPNDIDLIVVVAAEHDFSTDLNPAAYNVVSKRRVHRRFGFDLLVAREGSIEYRRWVEFLTQVRLAPEQQKGIVRLAL